MPILIAHASIYQNQQRYWVLVHSINGKLTPVSAASEVPSGQEALPWHRYVSAAQIHPKGAWVGEFFVDDKWLPLSAAPTFEAAIHNSRRSKYASRFVYVKPIEQRKLRGRP